MTLAVVVPAGRWQVKFTMARVEKILIIRFSSMCVAAFMLLNNGPDDKSVAAPQPASEERSAS